MVLDSLKILVIICFLLVSLPLAVAITNVNSCSTSLNTPYEVYNITQNISATGSCLGVAADGVVIEGNGFTITGSGSGYGVNSTNQSSNSWNNLTIQNLELTNFAVSVYTVGVKVGDDAMDAGSVNLINSTIGSIHAFGQNSSGLFSGDGGNGANVYVESSVVQDIDTHGGSYLNAGSGSGFHAGSITLLNSNATNLYAFGGDGFGNLIGDGGEVNLTNSNSTIIYTYSGLGSFATDTVFGGDVNLINSSAKDINTAGREVASHSTGGDIFISSSEIDLSSGQITMGNVDGASQGEPGLLTLDFMDSFDDTSATYSGNLTLLISNTQAKIRWFDRIYGNSISGLSQHITLSNNLARVNSTALTALNISANVTLYNSPGSGLTNISIRRDNVLCDTTTTPACYNFTALNASTVIFNVTSWTDYTLGGESSDSESPTVIIHEPEDGVKYITSSPNITLNTTVADNINVTSAWWSVDNGVTNNTFAAINNFSTITYMWIEQAFDTTITYNLTVCGQDDASNIGCTTQTLILEITGDAIQQPIAFGPGGTNYVQATAGPYGIGQNTTNVTVEDEFMPIEDDDPWLLKQIKAFINWVAFKLSPTNQTLGLFWFWLIILIIIILKMTTDVFERIKLKKEWR